MRRTVLRRVSLLEEQPMPRSISKRRTASTVSMQSYFKITTPKFLERERAEHPVSLRKTGQLLLAAVKPRIGSPWLRCLPFRTYTSTSRRESSSASLGMWELASPVSCKPWWGTCSSLALPSLSDAPKGSHGTKLLSKGSTASRDCRRTSWNLRTPQGSAAAQSLSKSRGAWLTCSNRPGSKIKLSETTFSLGSPSTKRGTLKLSKRVNSRETSKYSSLEISQKSARRESTSAAARRPE
mmetsp:Transcript_5860/g.9453  ORF Transcript_5860/g.9453 Transcript_5860/m.9453 type:complete len:239 (-) Transcript_5860:2315-3031(-)